MIHVWAYIGVGDDETNRRMAVAQESWKQFPRSIRLDGFCLRGGEPGTCYAANLIERGLSLACNEEVVFFSNADVGFLPGTTLRVDGSTWDHQATHIRKRNFQKIERASIFTDGADQIERGGDYPGMDAWGFTRKWWEKWGPLYPRELLFGRQHWDSCLRNLIRMSGGVEIRDVMWHEEHPSLWQTKACHMQNLHNERLLCEWIGKYGGSTQDHLYTDAELNYRR